MSEMEFMDDRERELFARSKLGEDARVFLLSDIGRYLHGRVKTDFEECKAGMLECNVDNFWGRRKFNRLKARAEKARDFTIYLADIITDGEIAFKELENDYET